MKQLFLPGVKEMVRSPFLSPAVTVPSDVLKVPFNTTSCNVMVDDAVVLSLPDGSFPSALVHALAELLLVVPSVTVNDSSDILWVKVKEAFGFWRVAEAVPYI